MEGIDIKTISRLTKIKERSEVMSLLLSRSNGYYNTIKKIFQYPLILITSSLVVVNSYFQKEQEHLKEINIALNASNIFLLAVLEKMKIDTKLENFSNKSFEFLELAHTIDAEMFNCSFETGNIEFSKVQNYQEKYDALMKNTLVDEIPEYLKRRIKNEYETFHLPLILGKISPNNSLDCQV